MQAESGSQEPGREIITDTDVCFFPKNKTPVIQRYRTLGYSSFKTRQNPTAAPYGGPYFPELGLHGEPGISSLAESAASTTIKL